MLSRWAIFLRFGLKRVESRKETVLEEGDLDIARNGEAIFTRGRNLRIKYNDIKITKGTQNAYRHLV